MSRRKWGHDVHKYNQVTFNNRQGGVTVIWRCVLPNCQHYLVGPMVIGKLSICNRCNKAEFEMKGEALNHKKPHCLECTKNYKGRKPVNKKADIAVVAANLEALLKVD